MTLMISVAVPRRRTGLRLALAAALLPVGAAALALAPPAAATGTLAVTGASVTHIAPNSTGTVTGLSVSGDTTDTLQVTVGTDVGTLAITSHANLTLAYGNSWSGDDSITFSGLQSDIDTALATVALSTGSNAGSTAHVTVTALVAAGGFNYLASNGHFYEYVASSGISWTAADAAAKNLTFDGQHGYLATIPSETVNNFLSSKIQGATNVWFGARAYESVATDGSQAYAVVGGTTYGRVWRWTVGAGESPIAGQILAECTSLTSSCDFANSGTYFQSWSSGEPNNAGGTSTAYQGEWAPVTNWSGGAGLWNDLSGTNTTNIDGYVAEFGGNTNINDGTTGFTGVVTSTSSVLVAAVPSAPTVTVTRANGAVNVSFPAPASNGSAITGYQVSTDNGSTWNTLTTSGSGPLTGTVSGLVNGTSYQVEVRAVNAIGNGAASSAWPVTPATNPGAPSGVTASGGNQSATISWTAPASNGSPLTGYTVTASPGGATCTPNPSTATSCTVTGLVNGSSYTFTVHATNGVGNSVESSSVAATPATVPGAPTAVTETLGDSSATVSWTAPVSNGGAPVTGYTVTSSPGGLACTSTTATNCTVAGLTPGIGYSFTVHATNVAGNSAESAPTGSATAITVPGAPSGLQVTAGDGSATLSFGAPADGGTPITGYQVSTDGGASWSPLTTSGSSSLAAALSGLTNGTAYPVEVRAVNALGAGAASALVSVTPATLPGPPTSVTATPQGTAVVVSWTAPVNNGGAPITSYTVTAHPGGATCTTSGLTSCTFPALPRGVAYTFSVAAVNGVGTSAAPAADPAAAAGATTATPVMVVGMPGAPTVLHTTAGNRTLTVTFRPPADDGGSAITGYRISLDGGRTWQPLSTSGSGELTGTVTGVTDGARYSVMVAAVNGAGTGAQTSATTLQPVAWFTDPISAAQRHAEIPVPAKPGDYRGPLATTTAAGRSFHGTVAMDVAQIRGRQLQAGQAATLGSDGFFTFDSATLTPVGKKLVAKLARSLRYAKAITCEGDTDYGGVVSHEQALSLARAKAVCTLLKADGARVVVTTIGYGALDPVVVGGLPADRSANRRVVILVTR